MLALTDGDSSPGSKSSEWFVADDATEEVLFLRIVGTLGGEVCGRDGSAIGLISGHAAVGFVANGLVVLDDLRNSLGEEVAEESKLRETGSWTEEKEATLLLRLGRSTLLT